MMTDLSLLHRDAALDPPPPSSCAGCAKAEPEIRTLLGHISNSFLNDPSKFLGFELLKSDPLDCSELFRRWAQNFDSDPKFPWCPDLRKRIEALVYRLLMEMVSTGSRDRDLGRKRKIDRGVREMLALLKCAAVDPCDQALADREWKLKVLGARKAMFLRLADVADAKDFPYLKKQKTQKFLSATKDGLDSCCILNNPIRRSQRTLLKLGNSELPRKRVPIGPTFQADIPDWTDPTNKEDVSDENDELNNSRWLGTQTWPIEGCDRQSRKELIGKRKAYSCNCTVRGSVECVKFHVNMARLHLKSDLGSAFFSLGFADMGEEVSRSWTQEEQMKFDDLVRQNPSSEGKGFWEPALEYFTSKRKQDIVSFYFNVFLLRWMSIRTRLGDQIVDSSDDESLGWE